MTNLDAERAELRRRLRLDRRTGDTGSNGDHLAQAVARSAEALPWWPAIRHLGLYRPFDGELDPEPLAEMSRLRGVETYVPVIDGDAMVFARCDGSTHWAPNRYGIHEPTPQDRVEREPLSLDLVIVPAVAVDRHGNRLGMGAGFYDRAFAKPYASTTGHRPVLVALVRDEQVIESVPAQPWDVPMDGILTPTAFWTTDA